MPNRIEIMLIIEDWLHNEVLKYRYSYTVQYLAQAIVWEAGEEWAMPWRLSLHITVYSLLALTSWSHDDLQWRSAQPPSANEQESPME